MNLANHDHLETLWDSLLSEQTLKSADIFKNSHFLEDSQQLKSRREYFLGEIRRDEANLHHLERASLFEEHENHQLGLKQNLETQMGLKQPHDISIVNHNKPDFNEDEGVKDGIEVEEQLFYKKSNFRSIFKEKKLRGSWKKNTNVPKLLTRIFMKYYEDFSKGLRCPEHLSHFKIIQKNFQCRSANNYSISDVLSLLKVNEKFSLINQRIMGEIINSCVTDEVIGNKYIKNNHVSYLIAIKLYAIRCRSAWLCQRVKVF